MKLRRVNGSAAAIIVAAFFLHAIMGALWLRFGFSDHLAWVAWIAAGVAGAHVGLSAATSYSMMADRRRPPSSRKKAHLALKWASGGMLLAAALIHVAAGLTGGALDARCFLLIVLALLTWHCFVGAKSLLKDLGIPIRHKGGLRALMAMAAAVACLALLP
ncbi:MULTISPECIES: hypothetical protein [unclassified Adlercreutzia]|uniref:hypothetical protein n=1 Tax=unclassified Adlercreutzia TaxID=2636013 RepID=UPI0013E9E424|nr:MULTISPECIES: hypothetical protein [unclassified Adlercreutzia]